MTADDLLDLAERCRDAPAEEEEMLLRLAFEAIFGPKPSTLLLGSPELDAWFAHFTRFCNLLLNGALIEAALTLIHEKNRNNWLAGYGMGDRAICTVDFARQRYGNTPALAICNAALCDHAELLLEVV